MGPTFLGLQVCSTPGPDFPVLFSSISVCWVEVIAQTIMFEIKMGDTPTGFASEYYDFYST